MNPEPWLTKDFIKIFKAWGTSNWEMFEWGSGASTIWFGHRVKRLISIEHDKEWYEKVRAELNGAGGLPVSLLFISLDDPGYEDVIFEYGQFDCILVDGRKRVRCGLKAMGKLKAGGILILDNAERPYYQRLHDELKNWQHHSTFNDVWKTDYWVKE